MHLAKRFRYGGELEKKLVEEVAQLAGAHPNGFAVRLHILGDFYSVEYVELWRQLLKRHPALHIWGYTARWDIANDPIAKAVVTLANEERDRFKMRFSDGPDTLSLPKTISVQCDVQVPSDSLRCPQQDRGTETCSTCTLCWEIEKRIAFRQH